MNDADAPDPVARFRALLAAEADLQDILARHERPESFVQEALEIAARLASTSPQAISARRRAPTRSGWCG